MNSTTPVSAIVSLVAFLLASLFFGSQLQNLRAGECVKPPKGENILHAGLAKFISQLDWMRLIQLRGGMEESGGSKAQVLAKKYERITNLDPMFSAAYEEGALDLGWKDADGAREAIELLGKAMKVQRPKDWKLDWKIPFMAGFICKMRLKDPAQAITFVEKAVQHPDCPGYVHRYLINLKSEVRDNNPSETLKLWVEYLNNGSTVQQITVPAVGIPQAARRMRTGLGAGMAGDSDRHMALTQISRISEKIISTEQAALGAEKDPERKKAILARIEETQKTVNEVYGNTHICPKCFRPYNAGDSFCVFDAAPLKPYGVCPKDGTVTRGTYCQKCGGKAN